MPSGSTFPPIGRNREMPRWIPVFVGMSIQMTSTLRIYVHTGSISSVRGSLICHWTIFIIMGPFEVSISMTHSDDLWLKLAITLIIARHRFLCFDVRGLSSMKIRTNRFIQEQSLNWAEHIWRTSNTVGNFASHDTLSHYFLAIWTTENRAPYYVPLHEKYILATDSIFFNSAHH